MISFVFYGFLMFFLFFHDFYDYLAFFINILIFFRFVCKFIVFGGSFGMFGIRSGSVRDVVRDVARFVDLGGELLVAQA